MTRTTSKLAATAVAVMALVVGACGGDDAGSGQQGAVVDKMMQASEDAGIALDRDCVSDLVGELSDADLKLLAEASIEDDVELSPEGEAVGEKMFGCVPKDELVDQIMQQVGQMEGVDQDCVRGVLEDMSTEEMQGMADGSGASDMTSKLMSCIDIGG
jgi:hypothetical protein